MAQKETCFEEITEKRDQGQDSIPKPRRIEDPIMPQTIKGSIIEEPSNQEGPRNLKHWKNMSKIKTKTKKEKISKILVMIRKL